MIAVLSLAAALSAGCGQDCFESKRMGDFEYGQGNYRNAIRHYLKALEADPACAGVKQKLEEAKAREAGPAAPAP
jgi:hypothetical protein